VGEDPQQALASYARAVNAGARLVVGPLVRSAVNAVAGVDAPVPTLLLNVPDAPLTRRNLYVLSLQIEVDARQVAALAYREGRRSVYTVSSGSMLMQRVHQAFVEAFVNLGGRHVGELRFSGSNADVARLREAARAQGADMAFLALDPVLARGARPALDSLPLYASSQTSSADPALAHVRILDMPWLLQPDHTAVMIYPRQNFGDPDLERLYALGIDAWRIGQALLARHIDISLDGVTGRLSVGRDRHINRELVLRRDGAPAPPPPPGPAAPAPAPAFPPAVLLPGV